MSAFLFELNLESSAIYVIGIYIYSSFQDEILIYSVCLSITLLLVFKIVYPNSLL